MEKIKFPIRKKVFPSWKPEIGASVLMTDLGEVLLQCLFSINNVDTLLCLLQALTGKVVNLVVMVQVGVNVINAS